MNANLHEIRIPALGESISEAIIASVFVANGDIVNTDDPILELETDKVSLEVSALNDGMVTGLSVKAGDIVKANDLIASIDSSKAGVKQAKVEKPLQAKVSSNVESVASDSQSVRAGPKARTMISENNLDINSINPSGPRHSITPTDILNYSKQTSNTYKSIERERETDVRGEKIVPMSRLRMKIAERLKLAQNTAAMLTTFNEVDMSKIIDLRQTHREAFEDKHGVRLGFMSFFVSATCIALQDYPAINAEINGDNIIYKNYYDIGVAVGTSQGLVVPIIRNAVSSSFAEIEKQIVDFGKRAREGKLTIDEISGGTFTITNGGIYGSLLSTPILNTPQSGILGLHKITKRPVVDKDDKIVVRPIMGVALSYDHRLVDGKDAVSFLVRIKELIEDPNLLLLE